MIQLRAFISADLRSCETPFRAATAAREIIDITNIFSPNRAVVTELVRALYSLVFYTILKVEGSNPGISFLKIK